MFIKLKQAVSPKEFAAIKAQLASGGVHVVGGNRGERVTQDHVIGQIGKTIFHLKGKIEVEMGSIDTKGKQYQFDKVDTVYYLRQL